MHLNNDRCPNKECRKLIHEDNYVVVGQMCFCDEKCYLAWWRQNHPKKDDLTAPFVK
jgi:hypothetical protein